ncbi:MAG: hypothetical protein HWN66_05110 [Candidatus Helarchaeota archaeon]|nr:hypothetical protein [Candidatus Helarchaeota archaeon]
MERSELSDFSDIILLNSQKDLSVTFTPNKDIPFFSWYPYVEGFSGSFVNRIIKRENINSQNFILDPYAGSGTTSLACTLKGINSLSIEVNPFMCFVARIKNRIDIFDQYLWNFLEEILEKSKKIKPIIENPFLKNPRFFPSKNLYQLLQLKQAILESVLKQEYKDLFLLALASVIVDVSHMKRCADLRYRRTPNKVLNVSARFKKRASKYIFDLMTVKPKNHIFNIINADIVNLDPNSYANYLNKIDYVITSPPYLNGTNYIRNTKLELALLDFIKSTLDLVKYHKKLITAGINSVKKDNKIKKFEFLKEIMENLTKVAYDKRIPRMVEGYFSDIYKSLVNIDKFLISGAVGDIVVGDSNFANVHVPTDIFFARICNKIGWDVSQIEIARERRSKNGSKLRESIIKIIKP